MVLIGRCLETLMASDWFQTDKSPTSTTIYRYDYPVEKEKKNLLDLMQWQYESDVYLIRKWLFMGFDIPSTPGWNLKYRSIVWSVPSTDQRIIKEVHRSISWKEDFERSSIDSVEHRCSRGRAPRPRSCRKTKIRPTS